MIQKEENVKLLKEVKEINRQRLTEYANQRPFCCLYHAGESVWTLKRKSGYRFAMCYSKRNKDGKAWLKSCPRRKWDQNRSRRR